MKRTLALFLALLMALGLCACGGGDSTTETLVSTDWKAVLDYPNPYSLSFNEDGTGSLSSSSRGGDITWSAEDNIVKIEYQTTSGGNSVFRKYTFDLVEVNGSYRLVEDNEADDVPKYWIFVPEDKYESETEAIKAERLEEAQEGWPEASNEAQFNIQYKGKLQKVTGVVRDVIASHSCCRISRTWDSSTGWIDAYMSTDDLARVKLGDTITVVGLLSRSGFIRMHGAFIV